jgi:hypothetical protein
MYNDKFSLIEGNFTKLALIDENRAGLLVVYARIGRYWTKIDQFVCWKYMDYGAGCAKSFAGY